MGKEHLYSLSALQLSPGNAITVTSGAEKLMEYFPVSLSVRKNINSLKLSKYYKMLII